MTCRKKNKKHKRNIFFLFPFFSSLHETVLGCWIMIHCLYDSPLPIHIITPWKSFEGQHWKKKKKKEKKVQKKSKPSCRVNWLLLALFFLPSLSFCVAFPLPSTQLFYYLSFIHNCWSVSLLVDFLGSFCILTHTIHIYTHTNTQDANTQPDLSASLNHYKRTKTFCRTSFLLWHGNLCQQCHYIIIRHMIRHIPRQVRRTLIS